MQISRHNAEAFFLDYYEGNLSQDQVAEMFAFLKANPDLRETFEAFGDVSVNEEKISAPDFSFLKKDNAGNEHETAEQWMVESVDGTISEADRISLEKYLEKYPAKRADLAALEQTILRADATESFGDTSSLKKNNIITAENFGSFAVALIEGTISDAERALLNDYLAQHPEAAAELKLFSQTKAVADENEVLADKSFLYKATLVVSETNIEELLIAKSEGELSGTDEAAVNDYIARFPEYKLELEMISRTRLQPDTSIVFEGKENLRKGIFITENNIATYAMLAAEGTLNSEETKALNAFVAAHPQYKSLVAQYAATRLTPDTSVVFEDKESLKRKKGGAIWWTAGVRFAAAAVVVIVFGIYLFMQFGGNGTDGNITPFAHIDSALNGNQQDPVVILPEDNNELASNDVVHSDNNVVSNTGANDPHNRVTEVNHQNPQATPMVFNMDRKSSGFTPAEANDDVVFSEALYEALENQPAVVSGQDPYISPGQFAMRWVKNKLDGDDEQQQKVEEMLVNNNPKNDQPDQPADGNVDGMDLTQSAVNRVGVATGGNICMDQRQDGTYLHLWKYSVRVSR